jgi:hypothetical protein
MDKKAYTIHQCQIKYSTKGKERVLSIRPIMTGFCTIGNGADWISTQHTILDLLFWRFWFLHYTFTCPIFPHGNGGNNFGFSISGNNNIWVFENVISAFVKIFLTFYGSFCYPDCSTNLECLMSKMVCKSELAYKSTSNIFELCFNIDVDRINDFCKRLWFPMWKVF